MSARVLFIGLDAAEPSLLRDGAARGRLPNLQRLTADGASGALGNCMETLPGAIWPEIASGVSCGLLPRFFHPRQLITGDAAPRPLTADDVADDPTFWSTASQSGARVAVVDVPHAPAVPSINGAQIVEYGLHDSHFGSSSYPGGLLDELRHRHGAYPVRSCDHYGGAVSDRARLIIDLLDGLERKTNLLIDLLRRERWDLFACAFSEAHCAGHWFWHFHDATHWAYTPSAPARLRDAVNDVYGRLDQAIGRLIDAANAETVIVLASHGMAPYVAGYQLLPEVLARLGLSSDRGSGSGFIRRLQHTAKHWIPRRYWDRLTRTVVEQPGIRARLARVQRGAGAMFFPLESPLTKAAYVPNNTIGAIRLNLRGREPFGSVAPGGEMRALTREIGDQLMKLRDPRSGLPIVSRVTTADDAFGAGHHPDVPDLIVSFRQDLGLLDACVSEFGRIRVPVGSRWARRTGDHSARSAVWIEGRGIESGGRVSSGNVLDIAPTVLTAVGCDRPDYLQGRPLVPSSVQTS